MVQREWAVTFHLQEVHTLTTDRRTGEESTPMEHGPAQSLLCPSLSGIVGMHTSIPSMFVARWVQTQRIQPCGIRLS